MISKVASDQPGLADAWAMTNRDWEASTGKPTWDSSSECPSQLGKVQSLPTSVKVNWASSAVGREPDCACQEPAACYKPAIIRHNLGGRRRAGTGRAVRKEQGMLARPLLSQVTNDALTRHLGDPEARILIEWLVDRAEELVPEPNGSVEQQVGALCRRARAISRFVCLWCYREDRGAATQLFAVERFCWPLPIDAVEPCELMQVIVNWETVSLKESRKAA
jgi:hypothetical protein